MVLRVSNPRSSVAGLLRDARIGAGLTQIDVAEREVQAICRVLGLSLVEFAVALGEREGRGSEGPDA